MEVRITEDIITGRVVDMQLKPDSAITELMLTALFSALSTAEQPVRIQIGERLWAWPAKECGPQVGQ